MAFLTEDEQYRYAQKRLQISVVSFNEKHRIKRYELRKRIKGVVFMTLGEKISNLRTEKGLNQKDFAQELGISTGVLAEWESNEIAPSLLHIVKISEVFKVSTDYLLIDTLICEKEQFSKNNNGKKENRKVTLIVGISLLLVLAVSLGYFVVFPYIQARRLFNDAAIIVNEQNAELDSTIIVAEEIILHPCLDKSLKTQLQTQIKYAQNNRYTVPSLPKTTKQINNEIALMKKVNYNEAINEINKQVEIYRLDSQKYDLVNQPTEEYIINCLEKVETIEEIEAVTEETDPMKNLNKPGWYISHVYFSCSLVNQKKVYGKNLIDKGTTAGGSIEVYKTEEEAKKREEYLATFDGGVLASGSHIVIGTCVVRTSDKLTATQQKELESAIIEVLTHIDEEITSNSIKNDSLATEQNEHSNTRSPTSNSSSSNEGMVGTGEYIPADSPTEDTVSTESMTEEGTHTGTKSFECPSCGHKWSQTSDEDGLYNGFRFPECPSCGFL